MPRPWRWDEFSENLRSMWSATSVPTLDDLRNIRCPVLLLFGDRNLFCRIDHIVEIYKNIPNAQLAIIPNSGHGDVSPGNHALLKQYIVAFIS
jgi:pimeloyl-ACP methyl ester carboxylesterase